MITTILYKNLKQDYLENFKKYGQVLISPLRDFSIIENTEKRDKLEGNAVLDIKTNNEIRRPSEKFNMPNNNSNWYGGYVQISPGANFYSSMKMPDVYVFCVSEEPKSYLGETSYKITDPVSFGYSLVKALAVKGKIVDKWRLKRVEYGSHKNTVTSEEDFDVTKDKLDNDVYEGSIYFIKPERFKNDKEWRYVFILKNDEDVNGKVLVENIDLLCPSEIYNELKKYASAKRQKSNEWFFKTGVGQYGEGDKFMGVSNPDARKVVGKFAHLGFADIGQALNSPIHEVRAVGVLILVKQFEGAKDEKGKAWGAGLLFKEFKKGKQLGFGRPIGQ
jgi:hypothetical protein